MDPLDPELEKLEKEIIDKFITSPLSFSKRPIYKYIMAYFVSRESLTQNDLRQLTGFSAGTISQEINNLLILGVIEIINESKTGELTYSMKSAKIAFFKLFGNSIKEVFNWIKKFENIKKELKEQKEHLQHLNGYLNIKTIVKILLNLLPSYEMMLKEIDDIIKE